MPDALIQFPLAFGGMPAELAAALRPHANVLRAKPGRTLVSPDSPSMDVYWVAQGRVQVALLSPAGHEVILRDQGAGDMFGEMAPIDQQPRSATIIALEDCVLISVPGPAFCQAVFGCPAGAAWLARLLIVRIRDLTHKVFELNTLKVPGRLQCELLRLCGPPRDDRNVVVIENAPTHAQLAARIGTHREAVTRQMRSLAKKGILIQETRKLTILDFAGLARLVRQVGGESDEAMALSA